MRFPIEVSYLWYLIPIPLLSNGDGNHHDGASSQSLKDHGQAS